MASQILIVGSGPSGLILGLSLLKNGVSVRIIEKDTNHHLSSRGSGVHARSLEIEYFLGTLSDLEGVGTPLPLLHFYDPADPHRIENIKAAVEVVASTPDFPMTKPLMVSQYLHEEVLRKHIEALGGKIELGSALIGLEQDDQGVTAEIQKIGNGEVTIEKAKFAYVVGADGARSTVRKLVGLNFLGETRETEKIYNADVELSAVLGDYGFHMFGNMAKVGLAIRSTNIPNRYQVVIAGPEYSEFSKGCSDTGVGTLQEVINALSGRKDIIVTKIFTQSEWKLNVRMVDHFQKERVFVIGDAAHAHSPAGGQGMNSSIQDAFNLGWKLALVIKRRSSHALLSSYEEERLPVIAEMLSISTALHRGLYKDGAQSSQDAEKTLGALDRAAAPAMATGKEKESAAEKGAEGGALFRGRKLFQLDINYRWSSIILDERFAAVKAAQNAYGSKGHDVRAGDRAPDAPGLFVLSSNAAPHIGSRRIPDKGEITRLFDVFDPTMHVILVFSPNVAFANAVVEELGVLPDGLCVKVLITPAPATHLPESFPNLYLALQDNEEHAFRGYGLKVDENSIAVIRPDGMIGAFTSGSAGVLKYFSALLGNTRAV